MNIFIRGYFYTTAASQTFGRWSSDMLREIREIKFEVTWSYVKRQTAKMTSEFVFFSSNPSVNHIKEKCLLLIATNTNIFTLLFNELKTDGKSFIFAVFRLTYDHLTSSLISLYIPCRHSLLVVVSCQSLNDKSN